MLEINNAKITVSELKTYLNSLEQEKEKEKAKRIHEYRNDCTIRQAKIKQREISKIEKQTEKEYTDVFKRRDELLNLLEEAKYIPTNIEKLQIVEYMLYRVDMRKTEKIVNKATKKLIDRYENIKKQVKDQITELPSAKNIEEIDYKEFEVTGEDIANVKQKYRLECSEEERNALIQKELDIIEKVAEFNSVPIPHEILKNSDKDIQSKMQKFNGIRQKRIRLLSTMKDDYKKLIDPRETLGMIDDALTFLDKAEDILAKREYLIVKNALTRKDRKIYRSTNDIRSVISAKEKKTGILNFNVQQARYQRMQTLRNDIIEATTLIRENPIEQPEEQLEKLKISYEREKQFASVIEKLDDGRYDANPNEELKAYEEQITSLQYKLNKSKRIVSEQQDRIRNAKKELLVLWKMEINAAVTKKKDYLELTDGKGDIQGTKSSRYHKAKRSAEFDAKTFIKLKKVSGGKHAAID